MLFFDEIDALGQSRGGAQQQQGVSTDPCSRRVLAELLIQLNRINTNHGSYNSRMETSSEDEGMTASCHIDEENFGSTEEYPTPSKENRVSVRVIIVAATNRPEDCDPALLRRFSVKVMVSLPSRRDRKKILLRFLADIDHTISTEQLDSLSLATEGWTGSDLESLTREAVMAPVRECIRCAALLKRRNARNRQRGGSSTCQVTKDDQEQTRDFSQEKILEQFTNLRSVSIQDFEDAIAFWAYNQGNTDMSNEIGPRMGSFDGQTIHYDSSSDEEE